jgi:hypothetical protein
MAGSIDEAAARIDGNEGGVNMVWQSSAPRNLHHRIATVAAFLVPVLCSPVASAQTVGWFNGAFNPNLTTSVSNYESTAQANFVFDDFVVPSGGWHIVGVFSNNLDSVVYAHSVSYAHWEIRTGVSNGTLGTVVAFGTNPASWIATGAIDGFGNAEYRLEVSGLNVDLPAGTHWLAVAPVKTQDAIPIYLSSTSGTGAIGNPPGNNGNSFLINPTLSYPENLSDRFASPTDYSLGVVIADAPDFVISVTPPTQTVKAGKVATYSVTVSPINGFTGTVDLTCLGAPTTTTCSVSPVENGTAVGTVDTNPGKKGTPKNSYNLTFRGQCGDLNHDVTVTLVVR